MHKVSNKYVGRNLRAKKESRQDFKKAFLNSQNWIRTVRSIIFLKSTKMDFSYHVATCACSMVLQVVLKVCLDSNKHFLYASRV